MTNTAYQISCPIGQPLDMLGRSAKTNKKINNGNRFT
jgi:hypothetical protein